MYKSFFKRLLDILISLFALIVLSPLLLILSILLFSSNHSNPFFFQDRPGKKEKIFKVIKFKTMNDLKDSTGINLPDSVRLTKIGKLIRSFSFDELPQLINVLKGDMSLIGPRPLLVKYLPLYSKEQNFRHQVRPGITGWAQVNGRNAISWQQKFDFDCWYVQNLSFSLDIKIFYLTIQKVFKREGINSTLNITMEPFKGNK